ncbi:conjugative transposon protein [Clostridioides difficile]|nr:conjugative transposon protein [Clostridioides difficile]
MDFTCIFFGILFTFAGFWLAVGKGYRHLSLWKNMPKEEKDKINIVPLSRNVGGIIALNGIIFLMKGVLPGFSNHWFIFSIIVWLIVASFDVWYIEKSVRYRNQ